MRKFLVAIFLFAASSANAQQVAPASKLIRENSPVIALTHVQLIDGTGTAAQADQTIVIDHGGKEKGCSMKIGSPSFVEEISGRLRPDLPLSLPPIVCDLLVADELIAQD
jgi:hypothetical protein